MVNKCVNPFVHRFRFRNSDYLRIFLGTIFLFPIRLVLMLVLFALTSLMSKLFNYLLEKWKLEKQEETEWRRLFKIPIAMSLRVMFFISGIYEIKVVDKGGPDAEKEAPIIVIAPHTSPFDLLCGIALNHPSVVARHDSVDIPLFGNIIKIVDPVFVKRDCQSSRYNVINSVLEKIKYLRIVFFPEGTCSNRRGLGQFKPGAFKPGLPIQPVAIRYDQFGGPDTLSWTWDGPSDLISIWLTLCRWRTGFELTKLPVYYPSEAEKLDADLYAKNLSELLSNELGLPNLKYSFDDVKYMRYRVFKSPVCLKFLKFCDKIMNKTKPTNGFKATNNQHMNGVNGVNHKTQTISEKNRIFCETVNTFIRDILEKIELSSPKDIQSIEDLIQWLNLDKYPDLQKSITLKEFYDCMENTSRTPNTTHLAIILQLCDMSVQSFWKRLENSLNSLAKTRLNGESNSISSESAEELLWLAFGIENPEQKLLGNENKITFDIFKQFLLKYFTDCIEENGRELLEEINQIPG